jgi:hypothetical protein
MHGITGDLSFTFFFRYVASPLTLLLIFCVFSILSSFFYKYRCALAAPAITARRAMNDERVHINAI